MSENKTTSCIDSLLEESILQAEKVAQGDYSGVRRHIYVNGVCVQTIDKTEE